MSDPSPGSDLAVAGRWRPPSRVVRRTKLALALGLWSSGIVTLFVTVPGAPMVRDAALLLFLALAIPSAKPITRTLASVGLAAAAALWLLYGDAAALLVAAERTQVFVLFLPALFMIRETLAQSPETEAAKAAFDGLEPGRRIAGLTIGSHIVASVMIIGALPIIRPFVVRQTDPTLRRELVRAAMRGFALVVLWSPFTVGMGFVLTQKPDVTLAAAVLAGLPLAALGLGAALYVDRRWAGVLAALPALMAFRSLGTPVAVAVTLVVVLASIAPLSTLQVVALALPPLCLLRLWALRTARPAAAVARVVDDLPRMGDELVIFAAAVLIGRLLDVSGLPAALVAGLALTSWPPMAVPTALLLLGPVMAVAGLHPIVAGTVLFAVMAPLDSTLPDLVQVQIVLFAWTAGAMVSYASLSVVAAAGFFDVPLRTIVVGVNLLFLLGFAVTMGFLHGLWVSVV
ncbi:MAG: hypothetical protein AAFX81_03285 [Pseudomonadota bacterium]